MSEDAHFHVLLTVGDHEQNGFVHLCRWNFQTEADASAFIVAVDHQIDDGSDPDHRDPDVPFTFILDLMQDRNTMIDGSPRNLPLQLAMRLAPEQVQAWLSERPDPDAVFYRAVPMRPVCEPVEDQR